jgi:hypothetical protein
MTVSIWQHVIVVIGLLTSNAVTFFVCKRRVEELKAALLAKRVLLGSFDGSFEKTELLCAGEKMTLVDKNENILEITSRDCTKLTVKVFDR